MTVQDGYSPAYILFIWIITIVDRQTANQYPTL